MTLFFSEMSLTSIKKFDKYALCLGTAIFVSLPSIVYAADTPTHSQGFFSNQIIILGLVLLLGFAGGKLIQVIKLPAVTGYVLIGILLGASALNVIQNPMLKNLRFVEALGLSLVALIIGGDLSIKKLKSLGKMVLIITIVQVLGAFFSVTLASGLLLNLPWAMALLLGAISSATAPAATVAVIHEYKAKGPLTDTLLSIVALDDAVCVILFSIVVAITKLMVNSSSFSIKELLLPVWDIGGSFIFGCIIGLITLKIMKWIRDKHELMIIIVGFAFLFGELAEQWHMSALLMNMMYGFVLVNFAQNPRVLYGLTDIELPIFVCFFTLAGSSLNLKVLLQNWLPALIFITARGFGKISGVYIGGRLGKAPESIKKYLGFGMLPQAGVSIALVLAVQGEYPGLAKAITAIVLAGVAVNEIIGPLGTKHALKKSGEMHKLTTPEHSE